MILIKPVQLNGSVKPSVTNSNPKNPEYKMELCVDDVIEFKITHLSSGEIVYTPFSNAASYQRE